jgi:hypothetical protein
VLLLLVSGLTFLASLYLPWQVASTDALEIDGWDGTGGGLGSLAGVIALAVVVACGVVLVRPQSLPLARCGLLLGYAAVAVAVDTWYERRYVTATAGAPLRFHFGYGAYLGLAVGAGAVLAAGSLLRKPPPRSLFPAAAAFALLIALALPWARFAPVKLSMPAYFGTSSAGRLRQSGVSAGVPDHFPEVAVRISEVSRVDPPRSIARLLRQRRPRRDRYGEDRIDLLAAGDEVADAELPAPRRVERRTRIGRQVVTSVERECQSLRELEHRRRPTRKLRSDDPLRFEPERAIEVERALEVGNSEGQDVNPGPHGPILATSAARAPCASS